MLTTGEWPIHFATLATGCRDSQSVSLLLRMFWNGLAHTVSPARSMIRRECVRRFARMS